MHIGYDQSIAFRLTMLTLVTKLYDRTISFPLMNHLSEIAAGSLPENGIYLPYRGISRHHFTLIRDGAGWLLRDEGSTNGTVVNGEKARLVPLAAGDVIQCGMIEMRVEEDPDQAGAILIGKPEPTPTPSGTDRLSTMRDETGSVIFSFPKFVLPEGFILGGAHSILQICERLHPLVDSDVNVLFVGETGAGKEMFARMLHLSGKRANGPFVAVNCAAIPSELIEAELFGIGEKVATDVNQRKGKFASAEGGTLFLDELEEYPVPLQAKILRAVEEKAFAPVGETRVLHVDFRLVSATNQDPHELIQTGRLREDLYQRLATVEFRLPPLRERKEDLQSLILGMLGRIAAAENKTFAGISRRLMALLLNYSYPGNFRELNNILRAMVALGHNGEMLDVHLIPERLFRRTAPQSVEDLIRDCLSKDSFDIREVTDDLTRKFVVEALQHHQGNIRKAAEHMKLTEFGLRKMIKRLGISLD